MSDLRLTTVSAVLEIVGTGATLVITGPDPSAPPGSPRISAALESPNGARCAHGYGPTIESVFSQLLEEWRTQP